MYIYSTWTLNKIEWSIKNGQSRDTDNIWVHKTQDEDKENKKKKTKKKHRNHRKLKR